MAVLSNDMVVWWASITILIILWLLRPTHVQYHHNALSYRGCTLVPRTAFFISISEKQDGGGRKRERA